MADAVVFFKKQCSQDVLKKNNHVAVRMCSSLGQNSD